ncbi:uncharacterized protein LOC115677184 [Syzygium oleosum]|uniref:uncharacterized protein LOC115677184 n=1 Tax=Syzygium oleosum TaxID=219896 RepID=UPI0024BA8405|nr:uncharacterized protein LOC115677184 [Syzygium oleosum]
MLVFLAAVIKNVERTLTLNLSSLPRFRERVLSHHKYSNDSQIRLVEELNDLGSGYSEGEEAKLAESIVVKHARHFFNIFDVFLTDLIYSYEERAMSCEYFHKVSAMDALRVISVELNFFYEMLHTKALTIHSRLSYIFRFIAFVDVVIAFILFNRSKKHQLPDLDVEITYFLLFGGIALDMIALFMLVFSDWTVASIKWDNTTSSKLHSFLRKFVSAMDNLRKPRFTTCKVEPNTNVTYEVLDTPLIFRRWSESISTCNLFSESLDESPRKMPKHNQRWAIIACSNIRSFVLSMAVKIILAIEGITNQTRAISRPIKAICCLPVMSIFLLTIIIYKIIPGERRFMIANTKNVSKNPFMKKLWIFIFKEVKRKSKKADNLKDVKKIVESSGALFLESRQGKIDCSNLLKYVTEANYDATILRWHIATEMWYNREKATKRNDEREFSKILSDYMLYLLFNQPNVVSAVAGIAQIISMKMSVKILAYLQDKERNVEWICNRFFEKAGDLHFLSDTESDKWRDPLKEGIELAREMESFGEMKWTAMSGVWVELLSYAAIHIKGEAHVQVLSKGGELPTFVWLLMAHFGCFYKPELGMHYEPFRTFGPGY